MFALQQQQAMGQKCLPRTSNTSNRQQLQLLSKSRVALRQTRTHATAVSPDLLLTWLETQGVDMDRLGVAITNNGLIAARAVAKGETAVSVPESLWITKTTAEQSPLGPFVADLESWLAVALFLIHERSQPASQWRPYLDALPVEVRSPVAWTDAELQELQGTQLLAAVESYRAFFQQRFSEIEASVFSANPEVFSPEIFTWEAFLWAACTVRARTHAPLDGEDVSLVPLADLIQHARSSNAAWSLKSAGMFNKSKVLAVEAERALREGEPISMDYGAARTEGQLLLDYGVSDSAAGGGSFALTITLPEDDRFFDDKIDILEAAGLQESNEFVLQAAGGAPESLLPTLRLVNVQGADAFLLEAIFRNEVWEHMQQPVSEDNEQAVCQSIVVGCRAVLAAYPTTPDEDVSALGAAAPGSRTAAAILVRLGEKEALEATLRLFESRLEKLSDLEYYGERRLKRLGLLDKEGKPTDWDSFFEDGIA